MSLLDTIKNLFCTKNSAQLESTTSENVADISEKKTTSQTTTQEKSDSVSTPKTKAEVASPIIQNSNAIDIPQDSTLKRHYLSALKTKIETEMGSYPTDSALKKQYDSAVQTQLDKLLS